MPLPTVDQILEQTKPTDIRFGLPNPNLILEIRNFVAGMDTDVSTLQGEVSTLQGEVATLQDQMRQSLFKAAATANQSVSSGAQTLVQLPSEVYDPRTRFNNTGSPVGGIPAYAFMPDVPGYYQVNAILRVNGTTITLAASLLYVNGTLVTRGDTWRGSFSGSIVVGMSDIVYLNGTTDYIQLYGQVSATSPLFDFGGANDCCKFSAALIRPD